jgi:hypothetical protein
MIISLEDRYTDNPDECVTLQGEFLVEGNWSVQEVLNRIDGGNRSMEFITRAHKSMLEIGTHINTVIIHIVESPTIIVRGTKIDTANLAFQCSKRNEWIDGNYQDIWRLYLVNINGRYNNLTLFQKEQLILRYQSSILEIIQDESNLPMIINYSVHSFITKIQEGIMQSIVQKETILEYIEETIIDGDDDNAEEN